MKTDTASRIAIGTLALVLFAASPVLAGSPVPLAAGEHLRATVRVLRDGTQRTRTVRGDLLSASADTLVLDPGYDPDPVRVARADVIGLERRTREGNRMRSVGTGLLVTTLIGTTIGLASGDDKPGWFAMTAGEKAVFGSVLLMPVGILVGLAASHGDAWEPVGRSDVRLGVGPTPEGGGGFALSVGF